MAVLIPHALSIFFFARHWNASAELVKQKLEGVF
jgi:hypothetical protein